MRIMRSKRVFQEIIRKTPIINKIRIKPLIVLNLTYKCNFNCNYCITPNFLSSITEEHSYKEWIQSLSWYKGHISITGGEPSMYKDLIPFLNGLQNDGIIGIATNLSFNTNDFIEKIRNNKDNIDICATYHPEFADLDEFEVKIKKLVKSGFKAWLHIVAHPKYLGMIPDIEKRFNKLFILMPYLVKNKIYKYNNDEKKILLRYLQHNKTLGTSKKKKCFAGYKYFHIQPNGDVYPCATLLSMKKGLIGNVFEDFKPYKKPRVCSEICITYCDTDYNTYILLSRIVNFVYINCQTFIKIVRNVIER